MTSYPTTESNISFLKAYPTNEKKEKLNRLEYITKLYLTSPSSRNLVSVIWCIATMCAAITEMLSDSHRMSWFNMGLALVTSIIYSVITIVSVICNIWEETLPSTAGILFTIFGGILHIVAGADILQFHYEICWAAIFSIVAGFLLMMDACVTGVTQAIVKLKVNDGIRPEWKSEIERIRRDMQKTPNVKVRQVFFGKET